MIRAIFRTTSTALLIGLLLGVNAAVRADVPADLLTEGPLDQIARPRMQIVGSEAMEHFTAAIALKLAAQWQITPPETHLIGTHEGFKSFCSGIGAEFPDIVAASRRMRQSELDSCIDHSIVDIIEVPIGYSALAFVMRRGDTPLDASPKTIYSAIVAEVAQGEELLVNSFQRWRQIDRKLPDTEIRLLVPDRKSGLRNFFDDVFMQGGCRKFSVIKLTHDAKERTKLCTTKRTDGRIVEISGEYDEILPGMLKNSPPGTVGVLPYFIVQQHSDTLQILPVLGILPSRETIRSDEYEGTHALYYYVKRAHMRNAQGVGVVRGLRHLIIEATSEAARAPGGYLEKLGLVPTPDAERLEQRRTALRLERFKR
ncbi:phosphate transport system substrate-binding protein [Azospirillaceae bacterium]